MCLPPLSLKGSHMTAQGNALGRRGRNKTKPCKGATRDVAEVVLPFQGDQTVGLIRTQGVALGFLVPAFQALAALGIAVSQGERNDEKTATSKRLDRRENPQAGGVP